MSVLYQAKKKKKETKPTTTTNQTNNLQKQYKQLFQSFWFCPPLFRKDFYMSLKNSVQICCLNSSQAFNSQFTQHLLTLKTRITLASRIRAFFPDSPCREVISSSPHVAKGVSVHAIISVQSRSTLRITRELLKAPWKHFISSVFSISCCY